MLAEMTQFAVYWYLCALHDKQIESADKSEPDDLKRTRNFFATLKKKDVKRWQRASKLLMVTVTHKDKA